jgi:hypothetical protein
VRLDKLAKEFNSQIQFLGVYIREAHPEDNDQVPRNVEEGIIFNDPTTEDERAEVAAACMLRYNFSFPMLLEKMDNAAEEAYQSWPDRLYLINSKGKIAYQGGMGPLYFDVDELEGSIRALLNS